MKKSRKLLMILGIVLSLAIATGSTLAYLTDTDSDVNVMTLGNVDIEQIEQEWNEDQTELKDFTQEKPLYPYVGELGWENKEEADGAYRRFTMENVVDKYVTVENTGKSDAYVRTFFAFEMGDYSYEEFKMVGISNNSSTGVEFPFPGTWEWTEDFVANIDGKNYNIMVAVHEKPLAPGEETIPSLLQVYLSKDADNEEVERLDGNENGFYDILVVSQAVQTAGFEDAETALNEAFGDPSDPTRYHPWMDSLGEDKAPTEYVPVTADTWDGTADTSWYNDTDTEFMIMTAEQLAGFAQLVDEGKTFEGKTVKVGQDIDLMYLNENGEAVCFEPIGSYRKDTPFKGTFDGQGNTIANMSQNTWALDNGYYYGDLGLGLFGKVEDATIKNLVMDNASISGEYGLCGTVTAAAYGDCVFENITVTNSDVADYQYYAGGIVAWASGDQKYINCDIDASTTIGGQWGDFNNCIGGIIGGAGTGGTYHFEDCDVACVLDAVNDVVSTYHWYCYRNAGMLIGNTGSVIDEDGDRVGDAYAPNVTCKNVTVTYDDWANYTYCEFSAMGEKYAYVRAQAGLSVDAYSNVRYGHPTDANGDTVTDENHVHNEGEDHHELIVLDQLFGGEAGDRYCYYGSNSGTTDPDATIDGVTIIYNNK